MDLKVGDKVRIEDPTSEFDGHEGIVIEIEELILFPHLVVVSIEGMMELFISDRLVKVKPKIPHGWVSLNFSVHNIDIRKT